MSIFKKFDWLFAMVLICSILLMFAIIIPVHAAESSSKYGTPLFTPMSPGGWELTSGLPDVSLVDIVPLPEKGQFAFEARIFGLYQNLMDVVPLNLVKCNTYCAYTISSIHFHQLGVEDDMTISIALYQEPGKVPALLSFYTGEWNRGDYKLIYSETPDKKWFETNFGYHLNGVNLVYTIAEPQLS